MNELNPSGRIGSGLTRRSVPVKVSFEFFPPGDEKMEQTLWQSIERLLPLSPRFVSVTYGADGSTRERTHQVVTCTQGDLAHAGASPDLRRYGSGAGTGYRAQLLAGGRAPHRRSARRCPTGQRGLSAAPRGFCLRGGSGARPQERRRFEISVAAFPEGHPEAPSAAFDLDNLRAKTEAGADRAITQFFFDSDGCLRFRDRCAAAGIRATLVPGPPGPAVPGLSR